MQIQRAQPASPPSTHRAGTEPAAGQGHCRYRADSDSTRPQGSLTSLWVTLQAPKGDLKTKLVSSTPNRSVETFSGPFLLIPPSHLPAVRFLPCQPLKLCLQHTMDFSSCRPLCPTGSLLLQPGLTQLGLPGFSCSAGTGIVPLPALTCLPVAPCAFLKQQLTAPWPLFLQLLLKSLAALLRE